jgi:hypothetical protein
MRKVKRLNSRTIPPAGARGLHVDGRAHLVEYDDSDNPIALRDGRTGQVLATGKYEDNRLAEERYHDGRFLIIQYGPSGRSYPWTTAMRDSRMNGMV